MDGEALTIPKKIPLPLPTSPKISLEPYLPELLKRYNNYAIFICRTCGYTEFLFIIDEKLIASFFIIFYDF